MAAKVVISGSGIISALGIGKTATLRSLQECRSGVSAPEFFLSKLPHLPVGEVKLTDAQLRASLGIGPELPLNRTCLLGMAALKEALSEAGLSAEDMKTAALVSGTTVGGMDKSEQFYGDYISDSDKHTDYLNMHDCGATTDAMADWLGGFSFSTTISTACSSAANAIMFGAELIRAGRASVVAAGGSECLSNFHLCGFNSLMILDSRPCRPFDAQRAGLNLGEGAAYLILESEESARRRGVPILAELAGCGNACDAFHQTATSPDGTGAFLAMSKALEDAGLKPGDIDYINAHGTGTPNNDATESTAIKRLFGDSVPPVSSTKSYTGHTTSASGSIEAVMCLLAMKYGFLPGSLNFDTADESCIVPCPGGKADLRMVMSNSFGFGGNDSTLIFKKA